MECGSVYSKEYTVPSTDLIIKIEAVCRGYAGFCLAKGYFYAYKYPLPIELSTCFEIAGSHYHGKLEASSDLIAPDSQGGYFKADEGPVTIPYILSKSLKLHIGDLIVLRPIMPKTAISITLQPNYKSQLKPVIPKLLYKGMEIVTTDVSCHEIYGGVFSTSVVWKVIDIEGINDERVFKYSRSATKLVFLPAQPRLLPKNLYKIYGENGIFGKLSIIKQTISTIELVGKHKCGIWLQGRRGCGKRASVFKSASKIGYGMIEVSMMSYTLLKDFEELLSSQQNFTVLHIRQFPEVLGIMTMGQPEILLKIRDIITEYLSNPGFQLLVVSSSDSSQMPGSLRNIFLPISVPTPSASDREIIFQALRLQSSPSFVLSNLKKIQSIWDRNTQC